MNLAAVMYEAHSLPLEEFVALYPDPVLLCEPFEEEDEPQLSTSLGEPGAGGVPFLLPIRSRVGGAHGYGDRITLGRTGNNDLVLPVSDVSKIHGYFLKEPEGVSYTDAHSTFGSRVDGTPAVPGVAVALRAGVRLELASVKATYLDPQALFEHFRAGF